MKMGFRGRAVDIFSQVTPQGPLYGLPLPEGLGIKWPEGFMRNKPYSNIASKSHFAYYKIKDKIFYMIRGL